MPFCCLSVALKSTKRARGSGGHAWREGGRERGQEGGGRVEVGTAGGFMSASNDHVKLMQLTCGNFLGPGNLPNTAGTHSSLSTRGHRWRYGCQCLLSYLYSMWQGSRLGRCLVGLRSERLSVKCRRRRAEDCRRSQGMRNCGHQGVKARPVPLEDKEEGPHRRGAVKG